jgi:hypothetical protein
VTARRRRFGRQPVQRADHRAAYGGALLAPFTQRQGQRQHMHGRRLAHLRRDRKTGDSVLTSCGQKIAEQHIFTERLSRGIRLE